MKRKLLKKIVSLICIACMLGPICIQGISASAENTDTTDSANEVITLDKELESSLKGFEYWTFKDVGIADDTYATTKVVPRVTGNSLDGTVFHGKIAFISGSKDNNIGSYFIGGGGRYKGFLFQANGISDLNFRFNGTGHAAELITTVTSAEAGNIALRGNPDLQISISVEYVNESSYTGELEGYTDLKVGLFLNGKLYGNQYFEIIKVLKKDLGTFVSLEPDRASGASCTVASADLYDRTPSKELSNITLLDASMSDGENKQLSGELDVDSLDNKLFSVWLTFNKSSRFYYALDKDTHVCSGIGFRLNESNPAQLIVGNETYNSSTVDKNGIGFINNMPFILATLDAQTAGVGDTFVGNQFLLQISTEFVECHLDGKKNDIKLGIFFNGKLYGNEYFYISDNAAKLGKELRFGNANMGFFGSYIPDNTELTEWSIRDAGMHDGSYSTDYTGPATAEALAGTSFSTMVNFSANSKLNLWIGDINNGFVFQGKPDDKVLFALMLGGKPAPVYNMDLDVADIQLTGNKNLKLTLSVEAYKAKGMKIGIYLNDVVYQDRYIYLAYSAASLLRTVNVDYFGDTIWLKAVNDSEAIAPPVDFEKVTLMDAGIMDGENKAFSGTLDVENLDKVLFSAILKYDTDFSRFHYGLAEHPYGGIAFRLEGDKMIISNERANYGDTGYGFLSNMPFNFLELDAEIAGVGTSFADTEFLLQISTEFVDKDGDEQKNDIKLGIFFNGKLYSNMYFYIKDNAEHLGNAINFNEGAAARFASYQYQEDYEELTATDFGLEYAAITGKTQVAKYDEETFDATAVNMMITFPKQAGGRLYLGGESSGVCLNTNGDGSISVSYVALDGTETALGVLEAKKAGVSSLTDKELEWRFAFHITPASENNGYLQLGIYVNGTLYNGAKFTLADVELASLKRTIAVHSGKDKFEIAAITYDELTLHDFSIRDTVKETAPADTGWRIRNYRDYETLDGTAFSVIYNFTEGTLDRFSLGGGFWHGVIFMSGENDTIEVCYIDGNGRKNIVNLDADTAGVDALTGIDVKVRLTFDIISPDDKTNDLRLGIYINDKLYGGKHFTVEDVDLEALTRTCKLYIVEGPYKIESIKTSHELSDYGFDENWRRTLGIAK